MKIIGIGGLDTIRAPEIIITYALGSCVGVCLYDNDKKVGGMAHVMLPDSHVSTVDSKNAYKYADLAVPELIRRIEQLGGNKLRMKAKIAGGAQMFGIGQSSLFGNVGERNIDAVRQLLHMYRIPIMADDTGKNYGRTVSFDVVKQVMTVKSVHGGVQDL